MLSDGLIDEVKKLAPALRANPAAAKAIGYRETLDWLDSGSKTPLSDLADLITIHTQQLIRKQRIWFRGQLPEHKVIELKGDAVSSFEF